MSERAPCVRCGNILHTGEASITVTFTVAELASMVEDTLDAKIQRRLICAIGLLDPILENELNSR